MAHKKLGVQKKGTGRAAMQFGGVAPVGGVGTARRDMRSGYYPDDMGMRGGPMYDKGGRVGLRDKAFRKGGRVALKEGNTPRENRLEELGRVKAEKASTKKGKKNLKAEKKRIVKELNA
jgi:hypothetical protein